MQAPAVSCINIMVAEHLSDVHKVRSERFKNKPGGKIVCCQLIGPGAVEWGRKGVASGRLGNVYLTCKETQVSNRADR